MTTVTFTNAVYRNRPLEGTFELVQDFTVWRGDNRRVGTKGAGYLKVRLGDLAENRTGVAKVTVPAEGEGYVVNTETSETSENAELLAEIAELEEAVANATGAERSKLNKRLKRRLAKLS